MDGISFTIINKRLIKKISIGYQGIGYQGIGHIEKRSVWPMRYIKEYKENSYPT